MLRLTPETAHHLTIAALERSTAVPGVLLLLRAVAGRADPAARIEVLGLEFPTPVGLAAGFDKDAKAYPALGALGFGFVEVGTLTAQAQPGNPRPRLFRLPADRALINRLGFNNAGADTAAAHLARRRARPASRPELARPRRWWRGRTGGDPVLGINVGKSKAAPLADAIADYEASVHRLAPFADYLVVNVSSPNTPSLRDLQATEQLRPLLIAVQSAACAAVGGRRPPPVLVKIAPDLSDEQVDAVADLALEIGLAGIVAVNTTVARTGLRTGDADVRAAGAGGLSGSPLKARSVEVLARLRARVGDRLVLVSVGGVGDADDAWERITAGATLVQLYTALVYGGPATPTRITAGLVMRAHAAGFARVQDAIGSNAR